MWHAIILVEESLYYVNAAYYKPYRNFLKNLKRNITNNTIENIKQNTKYKTEY